jgi:hypothetical protein
MVGVPTIVGAKANKVLIEEIWVMGQPIQCMPESIDCDWPVWTCPIIMYTYVLIPKTHCPSMSITQHSQKVKIR